MVNVRLNKEHLKQLAHSHYMEMKFKYGQNIITSFNNSKIYEGYIHDPKSPIIPRHENQQISVEAIDTVSAIYKLYPTGDKLAALNFASFKHPGGKFLNGSSAQEESLCHASTLYNILLGFKGSFYNQNRNILNCSLYQDKSIYTPDVIFDVNGVLAKCDIITCAAPNKKSAEKYHNVPEDEINTALISRIYHVLITAYLEGVDTLILGAFGCGVFGNDPYEVAVIFKTFLALNFKNCFKKVVFAIPGGTNYEAFVDTFNN